MCSLTLPDKNAAIKLIPSLNKGKQWREGSGIMFTDDDSALRKVKIMMEREKLQILST